MSLLDTLNGVAPPKINGQKRVHRIGRPDEDVEFHQHPPIPAIKAFGRPPQENAMPTGHYERKPKTAGAPAPGAAKALKRKKARKLNGTKPARKIVGAATFAVNDTGHLIILDGQQRIDLERDDVKRLAAFLGRTTALRA